MILRRFKCIWMDIWNKYRIFQRLIICYFLNDAIFTSFVVLAVVFIDVLCFASCRCFVDGFVERTQFRSYLLYVSVFIIGENNFLAIWMEKVNYPNDVVNLLCSCKSSCKSSWFVVLASVKHFARCICRNRTNF